MFELPFCSLDGSIEAAGLSGGGLHSGVSNGPTFIIIMFNFVSTVGVLGVADGGVGNTIFRLRHFLGGF